MFLLHPLSGNGSAFYGGIGSDVTIATAFLGSMVMFLRKHNCHVHRCWRLQWHPDPVSGHPVCKHHHPESGCVTA